MENKVKFVLPYIPMGTNEQHRTHWSGRHRENKQVAHDVGWVMRIAFNKPIPIWSKVKIEITGYNSRLDSHDNFRGACKHVIDSICNCLGILDDKKAKCYYNIERDTHGKRLEITITEIQENYGNRNNNKRI